MPIPTDTYWNIKRLNWIFAISAVLLLAVTGWSIVQDFNKDWRAPQRNGRVWEAALVSEKIDRESTPEKKQRLEELNAQIAEQEKTITQGDEAYRKTVQEIRNLESTKSDLEFRLNSVKAEVTVMETQLQDAIAAADAERVKEMRQRLAQPKETVAAQSEEMARLNDQLAERRSELTERTKALDALKKERTKLAGDRELLQKKLAALQPDSIPAKLSAHIRATPLLQFINPAERVQQLVLSDVQTDLGGFKKVETVDRCTTCHVNIGNKDFTEPKVLAYLEEQLATSRKLTLPATASGRAADAAATIDKPGPAAMPEFWHPWARELAPAAVVRNKVRTTAIAGTVGKLATVTVGGKKLEKFPYDPAAASEQDDLVLVQLIHAISAKPQGKPFVLDRAAANDRPAIRVEIAADVDEKVLATVRNTALRYVEELAKGLRDTLDKKELQLLQDRYRYAMVDEVNVARRKERRGLQPLDGSPVYLAHPDLTLYVDVDSKHPMEAVGCTSCHDGSGFETDFVLAAHTPRPIWVDEKTGAPVLPAQLRPTKPIAAHHGADLSNMLEAVYPHESLTPKAVSSLHLDLGGHHNDAHAGRPTTQAATTQPAATQHAKSQAAAHEQFEVPAEAPIDAPATPYVDPVTGRAGRAVAQATHWKKYEPASGTTFKDVNHYWDRPMLPPMYLQANCVRCHTDSSDIKQYAPIVNEGRMLFKNNGCVNCHQMDSITPEIAPSNPSDERLIIANGQRKVGTDLRHITAKLSPAMINTWIWSPKAFRPTTKMPHFFMLENNSSDEELRRTRQEARAITEYIVRTATPLPPAHRINPALKGSAEGGKVVFNNIGCLGCHSNLNDTTPAKRGTKAVTIGEQWIVNDLVKSGRLGRELEAQSGKLPDTKTLTAEAQKIYDGMSYNERQLYALEHLGERGELTAAPKYPDNTPKPIFMHHGPELSGIGTKLTAGRSPEEARAWLFDWLKEPRHYSEYTVMPQLRLTDQQAIDLVEYLLSMKRTNDDPKDQWSAGVTEIDSPKLIEMTSMFLRSRFSEKRALEKADEDAELLALATDALKPVDIENKAGLAAAEEQAKALTKDEKRLVFLGKKLISHYGCMSCHAINGGENLTSPCANLSDWGQKGLDKLDFGFLDHHKSEGLPQTSKLPMVNGLSAEAGALSHKPMSGHVAEPVEVGWPHVGHSRTEWITQKLKNTRVYDRGKALLEPNTAEKYSGKPYDKLKMPTFYLSDHEVDAIVTFVISNRDRLISPAMHQRTLSEEARQIALGRQVAEKYNCVNCHQIERNVPAVQQWYKADEMTTEAPPSLRGEGNKIQHGWLFNFLKNVEPLRPLLHSDTLGGGGNRKIDIRMPSFPIEDAEAAALAAYFAAASNKESNNLQKTLQPVVAYIAVEMKASPEPLYQDSAWPGDDWYLRPEFETAAAALAEWGLQNGQINALQLDRTKYGPDEMGRNMRQLLFKSRFTSRLYDAPYPFVDSPRPTLTDEQFKRGESLFYEMQCLKCHVLGDPTVAGANKTPTAPNLSLTHRRLQRRWVRHWVQEPPVIQTGTAMPPFLTGLAVDSQPGQTWPRSQGAQEAEVKRVESLYGDTPDEQADLVLDFLYAAGVRGYTGVQPAQAGALPGVTPLAQATPAAAPAGNAATQPASTQPAKPPAAAGATTNPAATRPATTQPLFVHAEYNKPILPGKRPEAPKQAAPGNTAIAAKPATPAVAGVKLTGKVLFAGKGAEPAAIDMGSIPECGGQHPNSAQDTSLVVSDKGEVQDVIVWVDGVEGSFPTRTDPAILDQKGCMYVPSVLAVQVGQPLVVKNSDPFLHNVHSMSEQNPAFNFGQPNLDAGKNVGPLRVAESFRVKCDVHPWMGAQVRAFEHPFFATTKADGTCAIDNLPPGTYTVRAWHPKLGERTAPLTVQPGKPATVELKFDSAAADASKVRSPEVVSLVKNTMAGASMVTDARACPTCTPK